MPDNTQSTNAQSNADVLVLGAGLAGLSAARAVAEAGHRVLLLEARERAGGRILSLATEHGVTVELGAEFVHGRAPELWKLIDECGAGTVERGGATLRELIDGKLTEDEDTETGDLFDPLEHLADIKDDLPFAEWLRNSEVPQHEQAALLGYVEGFNAADANRISARALGVQQKAEDEIEGDRLWHLRGGYAQLTDFLLNRLQQLGVVIRFDCVVESIRWEIDDVRVQTSGAVFRAPKCIIALPLRVLQSSIAFDPEPRAIMAARRLAMGNAARFTMIFRDRWWESSPLLYPDALRDLSFLFTPHRLPPVWWTTHPEKQKLPTLTGWAGGPRAANIGARTPEELGREACAQLAAVFQSPQERVAGALLATYMHSWAADPFSRGAYSYVPAGALDAPAIMSQPQAATLFFAGEHTDTSGHWGTVHAGLRSGLRASSQVLEAIRSR